MFRWIKEPKVVPAHAHAAGVGRAGRRDRRSRRSATTWRSARWSPTCRRTRPGPPYPAPPAGDLAAGRKTFETVGCLGCHRVGDDKRGMDAFWAASYRTHGPNLDGTGSKVNAGWLYAWIKDPKGYWHDTRMPNLRLTDQEAANITAYLMSLKKDDFREPPRPPSTPASATRPSRSTCWRPACP